MSTLDELGGLDLQLMSAPGLLVHTETLLDARNRLDGIIARTLAVMDDRRVTEDECGRTTRCWLVEEQRLSREDAGRRMALAHSLSIYHGLGPALLAGDITHDMARVIATCLRKLRNGWDTAAEAELIATGREHGMAALVQLCQALRIRSGADEDAEAAAERKYRDRWLTLSPTFDGMTSISGMLDPETAATLNAALAPLTVRAGDVDDRTHAQRRVDGLAELARFSLNHGTLPDHGGERPQVVVTIPWRELRDRVAKGEPSTATLSGHQISPDTARRLACDAGIIPAVLGGRNEVLNLGRSTPTWNRAQRRARRLEDGGCVFPKCQAPLARCQIHHMRFWALHGGRTDLANGIHVCPYHHYLVHHSNWTISRSSNGSITVHRT